MSSEFIHCHEGASPVIKNISHSGLLGLTPDNRDVIDDPRRFRDFVEERIPDVMRRVVRLDDPDVINTLRGGVDVAVPSIIGNPIEDGHSCISTDLPRTLLDQNRNADAVDGLSVEGKGRPEHGSGLIWRSPVKVIESRAIFIARLLTNSVVNRHVTIRRLLAVPGVDQILAAAQWLEKRSHKSALNRPYTQDEFAELLRLHTEYRTGVKMLQAAAKARHGFSVVFSGHTFPPNMAAKWLWGMDAGAYVFGPKAARGQVRGKEDVMKGLLPDALMITDWDHAAAGKPRWCHPRITDIVREELERDGLHVTNGFGPLQGGDGLEPEIADPVNGHHAVAVELVGHGDLEPDRLNGALRVNERRAEEIAVIYRRIFQRLGALTADDVRMEAAA